jgi:hypothetical protein
LFQFVFTPASKSWYTLSAVPFMRTPRNLHFRSSSHSFISAHALDLGNRVCTLARKAYPDINAKLRDELARDQFVRSLENVEMVLKLRHCMPETLDDEIR